MTVTFKTQIANHLKNLRAQKGLSLELTAKLTGVSKAMLGQIEREESSPTIATLWKITSGLETSFSAFFAEEPTLRTAEQSFPKDPHMQVTTLFPYREDTGFEVFKIKLLEYHQQLSSAHSTGVIEHIHVTEGSVNIYIDEHCHSLSSGDSLRFHADQAHRYEASTKIAVFQNIIWYPKNI